MNFRNLSAWSIRNPVPSIVLFVMLSVAGLVSFARMQVNSQPDIDLPIIVVVVAQPGAAPPEMDKQITQPIEAAVRSLTGIDEIKSTVTEGVSETDIQLVIGTPIDRAIEDVRSAVQQARSNLPQGILEPQVIRIDTSGNDLASYAAISSSMTAEQLSWYIDNTVSKELLSIPGMSKVQRNGGVSREIRVILDPLKLQAAGLTATAVNQQLMAVNLNAAGGKADIAGAEQAMRVLGDARTAAELGRTLINVGGRTIRLDDIAVVRDLYAEPTSASELDGRQVISFDFQRAKGGSDIAVFDAAKAKLAEVQKQHPEVQFQLINDSVRQTRQQYDTAMESMVEGAVLAVIVVFLFLRDARSTFISALAIPLSAIPTFWVLDLMGFTLNNMTLMALSLVAGVLVDDAIVEIENIVRHMRMGKSAYQAAIDAADEIGLAVLGTTMSIVAVFLPVAMMPGIPGQYFKNFGLTVVVSVLMSLAVARLITPMIAAYFLKSKGHQSHGEGWVMDRYIATLRWTLRHRWSAVVASVVALVLTGLCVTQLPSQFSPDENNDDTTANIKMVPGTTLADTQLVVRRVAAFLKAQPDVASVYSRSFIGNGRVTARFKPHHEPSFEFERRLAPQLAAIPDARVSFQSGGGWGTSGRDLTVVLGGEDPKLLGDTAQQLVAEMSRLPNIVAPRIEGNLRRPEIVIRPRTDLAANLGVTTAALSNAIRVATLGDIDQNSAKFALSDRQVPIRVVLQQEARQRLSTIQNLPVQTATGGSVPLSLVSDIVLGSGPTQIDRVSQERQITVGADLAPGVVSGDAYKSIYALPTFRHLPIGVEKLVLGQQKWQADMITNFLVAVIAGVFLVFAVLVLLYRRFLPPFVNMGSLLLAPLGSLVALLICHMALSLPVFIGLLMLLGIVAKNSILLIDFALEEMGKGVEPFAAILDAGHKRAQPIVMTTVAMVAGMLPTALSLSGGSSFRAPMGVTVIGGLILSTVLTLLIVPASFSLALGVEGWIGSRLGRRLLTYRPGDDGTPVIDGRPPEREAIGYAGPVQPAE